MCTTCGCDGEHPHPGPPAKSDPSSTIVLDLDLLAENRRAAERNRAYFQEREILALHLTSSPGAGKTTLLERTIARLRGSLPIFVLEGDQETPRDAERIRAVGARALQINTGTGCHLDAQMVERALGELDPAPRSLLLIENVGNLVCPALFDLGERKMVLVTSVAEGDDKPLKYPHMFRAARLLVLNKIDLLPHVEFDVDRFFARARRVGTQLELLQLSATREIGLDRFCDWLRRELGRAPAGG